VARSNDRDGLVEWVHSDGFAAFARRRFDAVVANPPYLTDHALVSAAPELGFEPPEALASGPSGYEAHEVIARDAPGHLRPGGWLLVEVGLGQAEHVGELFAAAGLVGIATRPDLAGIPRVVGGMLA
jgi:release factor glutamine methyltransferase